jgi:hypothetical protein
MACSPFTIRVMSQTDAGEDDTLEIKHFAAVIVFGVSFRLNRRAETSRATLFRRGKVMESLKNMTQLLHLVLPQSQPPAPEPVTVTLVAISEETPLAHFAAALTESFAKLGSTKRINLPLFRQSQTCSFAARDDQQWIDLQSRGRRFVVFQTHTQAQAWTELGVQRADVVLLVGKLGANPAPGRVERLLQHLLAEQPETRVELVLLSDGETSPLASASPWLTARKVTAHHYINLKGQQDLDRLAHSLSQRGSVATPSVSGGNWNWNTDSLARVYA